MKYYVSYFYQVRFFKRNCVAFSTAVWDPKWFHLGQGNSISFIDKNGVLNGLRVPMLRPGSSCSNLCRGKDGCKFLREYENGTVCPFLVEYRKQLEQLDYEELERYVETCASGVKANLGFDEEPEIIFLVHEAPYNKCSEREVILSELPKHGIEISEWQR